MGFRNRNFGIIGAIAAMGLAGSMAMMGPMTIQNQQAILGDERPIAIKRRRDSLDGASSRAYWGDVHYPRPSRSQRHSGGGSASGHLRWKKRRAAGIY